MCGSTGPTMNGKVTRMTPTSVTPHCIGMHSGSPRRPISCWASPASAFAVLE